MSEELKPCPFCGSNRIVEDTETDNSGCVPMTVWFVKCTVCGSFKNSISNPDRARKRWNTRPAEDALRYNLALKKAALLVISQWCDRGLKHGMRKHDMNEVFLWIRKLAKEEMEKDYDTDR